MTQSMITSDELHPHRAIVCTLAASIGCFAEEGSPGGGDDAGTSGSGSATSSTTGASGSTAASTSGSGGVDSSAGSGSETSVPTSTQSGGSSDDAGTDATSPGSSESVGAVCGNGTIEPGEECDDENARTGDGCHTDCTLYKTVFLTDATMTGTGVGGLAGANETCQGEAIAVGFEGQFAAWLSTSQSSASSQLTHSTIPYRLVDGTLVASDWTDLTDGMIVSQIDLLASGGSVAGGDVRVWTGTGTAGELISPTCGDWGNAGAEINGHVGRADWLISASWTDHVADGCNLTRRLYCVEQ